MEKLTIEVLADSTGVVSPDVVEHAAAAVLHYFKDDLGRDTVTVDEFTAALEHVLRGLGFDVISGESKVSPTRPVAEGDLAQLAATLGAGLELEFYTRLRTELRSLLSGTPHVVRFRGLRDCAMRLAGVRRWCRRSAEVNDEIVGFLRECWGAERPGPECSLIVN